MTAKLILNPYAGRWTGLRRRSEAERALQDAGVDYQINVTSSPREGDILATRAVQEGFDPIIAAGGDGSISEAMNGVLQASGDGPAPSFGILPLGSANDLVVNLGLPLDLNQAARVIADGHTRLIDLGIVNGRYFDNNAAVGLEPFITLIQERIQRIHGTPRYIIATLRGILARPEWRMHLEWDDGEYEGPVTLVTVGNNPLTGGAFYVTPHASPYDGKLTFVHGYVPTRRELIRLLPRIMKPGEGSYVEHPAIHEIHTTWLRVRSEQPTPAHADGEIMTRSGHTFEYRVVPARLPVLMPAQEDG